MKNDEGNFEQGARVSEQDVLGRTFGVTPQTTAEPGKESADPATIPTTVSQDDLVESSFRYGTRW